LECTGRTNEQTGTDCTTTNILISTHYTSFQGVVVNLHGNHLHVSALELAVKLILVANHQVVDFRVVAHLVTMHMVAERSMARVLFAVAFDFFVTHVCDRRLVRKRGSEVRLRPPLF
jgi:hypothetical protein